MEKLVAEIRESWPAAGAPPVRLLPAMLPYESLPVTDRERPGLPIGIAESDLRPVWVDLTSDPHFLLFGEGNVPWMVHALIRKTEPKPIRVFLEDGSNDQNIYGGDWWMANQEMERALTFAGYEVNHAWGERGHDGTDGTKAFPDAMRWLWKDWPNPIKVGGGSSQL